MYSKISPSKQFLLSADIWHAPIFSLPHEILTFSREYRAVQDLWKLWFEQQIYTYTKLQYSASHHMDEITQPWTLTSAQPMRRHPWFSFWGFSPHPSLGQPTSVSTRTVSGLMTSSATNHIYLSRSSPTEITPFSFFIVSHKFPASLFSLSSCRQV